jgi:hypothetical protein
MRGIGRLLIHALASYLVDFTIPDLNSGLRLVSREKFLEFRHLYPRGFSLSSTVTLAFLKCGYSVGYVPVEIARRATGRSTVGMLRDGIGAVNLIVPCHALRTPKDILADRHCPFSLGTASFIVEVYRSFNIGESQPSS